jgi:hypothetical protein
MDQYLKVLLNGIDDLTSCNWRLQRAIDQKDRAAAQKCRDEFICKAFKLGIWAGMDPDVLSVSRSVVRRGVNFENREKYIYDLSILMSSPLLTTRSEEPNVDIQTWNDNSLYE